MLGNLGVWRHVVAAGAIGGTALLAATGVIGSKDDERFDSKVVTVEPAGDDGVRIREVVDQDFGGNDHHGYERIVTTDFGDPIDIEASSPDANADVDVDVGRRPGLASDSAIPTRRTPASIATSSRTHCRMHGYRRGSSRSTSSAIRTSRRSSRPSGSRSSSRDSSSTTRRATPASPAPWVVARLARDGDVYRAVISPLKAGEGITIGGTITGRLPIVEPVDPPLPKRRANNRLALSLATIPLGLITVGVVYWSARRRGRNEVFAGGAADAAYGSLPSPASDRGRNRRFAWWPTAKMDELATIEFVPPKGLEPWQGAVLLNEKFDRTTIASWVSGLVAKDAITLDERRRRSRHPSRAAATTASRATPRRWSTRCWTTRTS